jgi:hypothetical protein
MEKIKALFLDDENDSLPLWLFRQKLRRLDVQKKFIVGDYSTFVKLIQKHRNNCILFIDVLLSHDGFTDEQPYPNEQGGIRALRAIRKDFGELPRFILSSTYDEDWASQINKVCSNTPYLIKRSPSIHETIIHHLELNYNIHNL